MGQENLIVLDQRQVGLLFTEGQQYARVVSG